MAKKSTDLTTKAAAAPAKKKAKPAPAKKKAQPAAPKRASAPAKEKPKPAAAKTQPAPEALPSGGKSQAQKTYSIEEFSKLTYLTPKGVLRYLQEGILSGERGAEGQWRIPASNLELLRIRHLVR